MFCNQIAFDAEIDISTLYSVKVSKRFYLNPKRTKLEPESLLENARQRSLYPHARTRVFRTGAHQTTGQPQYPVNLQTSVISTTEYLQSWYSIVGNYSEFPCVIFLPCFFDRVADAACNVPHPLQRQPRETTMRVSALRGSQFQTTSNHMFILGRTARKQAGGSQATRAG